MKVTSSGNKASSGNRLADQQVGRAGHRQRSAPKGSGTRDGCSRQNPRDDRSSRNPDAGKGLPHERRGYQRGRTSYPVLFEYGDHNLILNGLLALPFYVGVGRLKNQAHWQTEILAGWALGAV